MNLRQMGTKAMGLLVRMVKEAECYALTAGSLQELGTLLAGLTRSGRRSRKP